MFGFEEVYEQYSTAVYRFLLSLTRDEVLAEELLQETFYRALLNIDKFEGRSSLYTWLCQIGKNAWLKECKKKNVYHASPIEEFVDMMSTTPLPEEQVMHEEEYKKVKEAVVQLVEPYKAVFILHAYAGINLKEIAFFYGKSESWARVTYYRAKQKIIEEVSKYEDKTGM